MNDTIVSDCNNFRFVIVKHSQNEFTMKRILNNNKMTMEESKLSRTRSKSMEKWNKSGALTPNRRGQRSGWKKKTHVRSHAQEWNARTECIRAKAAGGSLPRISRGTREERAGNEASSRTRIEARMQSLP